MKGIAEIEFESALEELTKECAEEMYFDVDMSTGRFPVSVSFMPQQTIFDAVDEETGVVPELRVEVGLSVVVKNNLTFKMDAKKLKKLIGKAEKLCRLWYMAFMEETVESRREKNDKGTEEGMT